MVELSSTGKLKDMTYSFQTFSNNPWVAFVVVIAEEKEKQREKRTEILFTNCSLSLPFGLRERNRIVNSLILVEHDKRKRRNK